jgi:hypothetical protein
MAVKDVTINQLRKSFLQVCLAIVNITQSKKVIVVQCQDSNFSAILLCKQVTIQWDENNVHFLLDQHA